MEAFRFTFDSPKLKSDFFFILYYLTCIDTAEIWLVNLVSFVCSWMLSRDNFSTLNQIKIEDMVPLY